MVMMTEYMDFNFSFMGGNVMNVKNPAMAGQGCENERKRIKKQLWKEN